MPVQHPEDPDKLGLDQLSDESCDRILGVCERFEAQWTPSLKIAPFLDPNSEDSERRVLLLKLISIDAELRRSRGLDGRRQTYLDSFPEHQDVVRRALAEVGLGTVADDEDATISTTGSSPQGGALRHDLPRAFGDYQLLEVLGKGGAGVVYRARQLSPDRLVALKMLSGIAQTPEMLQRFRHEADAAAKLNHPRVLTVYEAREHAGQPYIAMQYVEGRSLKELHEAPVHGRQAARYVRDIALAVEHAHAKGVLHRDIKPSNVMVDESGEVYLADFGLAKAVDGDAELTRTGNILGTPSYMSPEQARGDLAAVGPRSDVYSLGALLYALLTGQPPLKAADISRTLQLVLEREPLAPRQQDPEIDRDIETICLKCLEKSPAARYGSAGELAADLDRYLNNEPILARPHTWLERSWRWGRRHRVAASIFALLAVVLGLSVGLAAMQTVAARTQSALTGEAQQARRLAEARQTKLEYELAIQSTKLQQPKERLNLSTGSATYSEASLQLVPESVHSWDTRWLKRLSGKPLEDWASFTEGDSDWGLLDAAVNDQETMAVSADAGGLLTVWDMATGRALRRFVFGRKAAEPRFWLHHFMSREPGSSPLEWGPCYVAVQWINDNEFIACSLDGQVTRFDSRSDDPQPIGKTARPATCLAVGAEQILVGDAGGGLTLFSLDGEQLARLPGDTAAAEENDENDSGDEDGKNQRGVTSAALWLPEQHRWLAGFESGLLLSLDDKLHDSRQAGRFPGPVHSIAGGRRDQTTRVALGCGDNQVRVTVVRDGRLQGVESLTLPGLSRLAQGVHCVAFAGRRLYAGDDLGRLTQWDLDTGRANWNETACSDDERTGAIRELIAKHSGPAMASLLQPFVAQIREVEQGRLLLTAGRDLLVRLRQIKDQAGDGVAPLAVNVGPQPQIRYDSQRPGLLWSLDSQGTIRAVDVAKDRILSRRRAHSGGAAGLAVFPDASRAATVGGDKEIKLWVLRQGRIRPAQPSQIEHDAPLLSVALSPDGKLIAAVDEDARLAVWNAETRRREFLAPLSASGAGDGPRPLTGRLAFSPDGALLCAFGPEQEAPVFQVRPFRRLQRQATISGKGGTALVWNPRHPEVVIAGNDYPTNTVTAIDRGQSRLEQRTIRPTRPAAAMRPTPDGRRILVLEEGGRLLFVEAEHHIQLLEMTSPQGLGHDLAVDPGGNFLVLAGRGGELELLTAEQPDEAQSVQPVDRTSGWFAQEVIPTTEAIPRVDGRGVAFDSQNRLCLLMVESRETDHRDEGALYFLRPADQLRERIAVDGAIDDRQIPPNAVGLVIDARDQPRAVFRRKVSGHGGEVWTAHRRGLRDWTFQRLLPGGNSGFYPQLRAAPDGTPQELIHFSFYGFQLLRSRPRPGQDDWQTSPIGRIGDGLQMQGRRAEDGSLHLFYRWNPVNAVASPMMYARWDGERLLREVIDPLAKVGPLQVTPDGEPVVLHRRAGRAKLLRRRNDNWEDLCPLPDDRPLQFVFAGGDRILAGPVWKAETGELLLWRRQEGDWSLDKIATGIEGSPNWFHLLTDNQGRPAVLYGENHRHRGWLKLLRPREP